MLLIPPPLQETCPGRCDSVHNRNKTPGYQTMGSRFSTQWPEASSSVDRTRQDTSNLSKVEWKQHLSCHNVMSGHARILAIDNQSGFGPCSPAAASDDVSGAQSRGVWAPCGIFFVHCGTGMVCLGARRQPAARWRKQTGVSGPVQLDGGWIGYDLSRGMANTSIKLNPNRSH
jgi:hypothetical protein